jgi:hypothetical protein
MKTGHLSRNLATEGLGGLKMSLSNPVLESVQARRKEKKV